MGKRLHKLSVLSCFLVLATLLHHISATKFIVTNNAKNTPGGARFDREVGASSVLQMIDIIVPFIWRVFEEVNNGQRKDVDVVNVFISDYEPPGLPAYTNGNNINFSAKAIQYFPPNQAKFWFASAMYRQMARIYQWDGNGATPEGLLTGYADYVMVKSNIYNHDTYPKPGSGSRWDEGYGVTERFLEYCESVRPHFVVTLNKMMRFRYNEGFLQLLTGKYVDQLWREYKAKYNQP